MRVHQDVDMVSDFSGRTARRYRRFRRDVSDAVVDELITRAGWSPDDLVIDLGCGTGQATVPIARRVTSVLACDVEPDQLSQLRDRLREERVATVVPCLIGDADLSALAALVAGGRSRVAGLVVANALHWMDEASLFEAIPSVVRPGGTLAVITHGRPLWLGTSSWQRAVRALLEQLLGPITSTCGSDEGTLDSRADRLRNAGYAIEVIRHRTEYPVDSAWVLGHLLTAVSSDRMDDVAASRLGVQLDAAVPDGALEEVVTSVLVATTGTR